MYRSGYNADLGHTLFDQFPKRVALRCVRQTDDQWSVRHHVTGSLDI